MPYDPWAGTTTQRGTLDRFGNAASEVWSVLIENADRAARGVADVVPVWVASQLDLQSTNQLNNPTRGPGAVDGNINRPDTTASVTGSKTTRAATVGDAQKEHATQSTLLLVGLGLAAAVGVFLIVRK